MNTKNSTSRVTINLIAAKKGAAMAQDFDEQEYTRKLITGGVAPDEAANVARRTAEARRLGGSFGTSSAPSVTRAIADKAKPPMNTAHKAQEVVPLSTKDQKLIDAGVQIATTSPDGFGNFMAFAHAVLCQVGLPRSKVEGREFLRQSGAAWINIQAGILDEGKGPVLQPIPYGVMPRLALAWVSTFAVRNDTPVIPLGNSAAEFLRLMGMDDQGARYATLRRQMHALATCRLQMGYKGRNIPNMAAPNGCPWRAPRILHPPCLTRKSTSQALGHKAKPGSTYSRCGQP